MELIQYGEIRDGKIELPVSLDSDDGTKVIVRVEIVTEQPEEPAIPIVLSPDKPTIKMSPEEFAALPVFGMWADREDMKDSVEWVRKERRKWSMPRNQAD